VKLNKEELKKVVEDFEKPQKQKEDIENISIEVKGAELSADPESINKMNVALNGFHIAFIKAICEANPELKDVYNAIYQQQTINWKVKGKNETISLNGEELHEVAINGLKEFAKIKEI